jgi:hypothetical protein
VKAIAFKIGIWLFVKSLESAADEYMDDGDAEKMRTTIIEYVQARQDSAKSNGKTKHLKSRVWRYFAIVMASNRLDAREQHAVEVEHYTKR